MKGGLVHVLHCYCPMWRVMCLFASPIVYTCYTWYIYIYIEQTFALDMNLIRNLVGRSVMLMIHVCVCV